MHQYSRRELLTRGAAVGAATVAAPALLGGSLSAASAATKPARRSPGRGEPVLESVEWLQQWEEKMVGLGNRMGGTKGLVKWIDLIQEQLQRLGLSTFRDTQQMPAATPSWNATAWKLSIIDGLRQTPINVAA